VADVVRRRGGFDTDAVRTLTAPRRAVDDCTTIDRENGICAN
jgi:hypothetical protein